MEEWCHNLITKQAWLVNTARLRLVNFGRRCLVNTTRRQVVNTGRLYLVNTWRRCLVKYRPVSDIVGVTVRLELRR